MKNCLKKITTYLVLGVLYSTSPLFNHTSVYSDPPKYQVEFRGVESSKQLRSLKNVSSLIRYKKNRPRSLAALKYRAERDIPDFIDVLHAYSFYDACVNTRVFRLPSGKLRMLVAVKKGDPYLLSKFQILTLHEPSEDQFDLNKIRLREIGIKLNRPALSTEIVKAEKQVVKIFTENGYPLAKTEEPDIIVDQAKKTVDVSLKIDEGPIAYFGDVNIIAGDNVRMRYIKNRIAWKEGELYNSEKVLKTEKNFYDSALFSMVTITHGESVDKNKKIPLTIDLTDAKYNNLTLGGSYTTTWEGFGGTASWQNRNIFRSGINLKINYGINQKKQEAGLEFLFPDFLSPKQKLIAQSDVLIQNNMPNYSEQGVDTKIYIERVLSPFFTTSLGVKFDQFKTTKSLRNGYFSLFGIPFFLNTQSSDKVLINPYKGGWGSLNLTPYFSMNKEKGTFTEVRLEASAYQHLIPSRRIILAMNMVVGTLFGTTTYNIPPTYRFYAGSPQHLRGYPYQKISPLNANGDEVGGKSLFLWSIEPRFVFFEPIQFVCFLDVGNVYTGSWPKWDTDLVKALGVGIRYFSFIGPLRLDVGFPLTSRPNIKRRPQFYFSIGQAF